MEKKLTLWMTNEFQTLVHLSTLYFSIRNSIRKRHKTPGCHLVVSNVIS